MIIDSIRKTRTKKGEEMAFMTVSDITGTIGITVFSQVLTKTSDLLKTGTIIEITGKIDSYNGKLSIIANQIHHAPDLEPLENVSGTWFLQFDNDHDTVENRHDVIEILKKHHGDNPVVIYWQNTEQKQTLDSKFWMSDETGIIVELSTLLGYKNVVFRRSQ